MAGQADVERHHNSRTQAMGNSILPAEQGLVVCWLRGINDIGDIDVTTGGGLCLEVIEELERELHVDSLLFGLVCETLCKTHCGFGKEVEKLQRNKKRVVRYKCRSRRRRRRRQTNGAKKQKPREKDTQRETAGQNTRLSTNQRHQRIIFTPCLRCLALLNTRHMNNIATCPTR